ncbi:MAG: amidohydrolase [Alphaproteobacteria bacterium]|nr:amidohydrolase [Alphaproteobacteria bacterium]
MMKADLVLRGGRIATLDAVGREVQALAASSGRIVALGRDDEMAEWIGARTEIIELKGRRAIPGIIDSHCHPDSHAARVAGWHEVDPSRVKTRDELLSVIDRSTRSARPGAWFAGYRLNERRSGGYPTLAELDRAGNGHPVFILRTDGHIGLANSAAFAQCRVTRDTPDPPFGRFDHDPASGDLTGLVRETAAHLFLEEVHRHDTVEDVAAGLEQVFAQYLAHGITSLHNSLTSSRAIQAYQIMRDHGRLHVRVGMMISGREAGLVEATIRAGLRTGFGDEWVRVVGVEWCPDCSTSGRTAAYYEPYVGTAVLGEPPDNCGMLLYEAEDLKARVTAAHQAGLIVCLDGVGDRGVDFCLDMFEAALAARPSADHRMRVEHCCYVTPRQQARLKKLGVIDSSATGFMYDLGEAYVANRGPAAMRWMWPHRTLLDQGVVVAGHSDAAVCQINPWVALYAMVARKAESGVSLGAEEAITITEALRCYTITGAYLGREENLKGSLELGKLADIAVLDRDVLTIPVADIRRVQADLAIVGGAVKYRRG